MTGPRRAGSGRGLALALLALAACGGGSSRSGMPKQLEVLQLSTDPTHVIGRTQGDSDYVFESIASVRHLPSGNVLVADRARDEILEYTGDGTFVRRIGGEGKGPGEFEGLSHLYVTDSDSILAEDALRGTISVFDSAGRFARQIPARAVSGDSVFSMDVWLYGRFWVEGALTPAQRARARGILDRLPEPTTAPGYRLVLVDDEGRLWIRGATVTPGNARIWTRIDTDGRPSGSLAMPVRFEPEEIRAHDVSGRWLGQGGAAVVRTYDYGETGQLRPAPSWLLASPAAPVSPADRRELLATVKATLRRLAPAEEIHYAKAHTYTDILDSLAAFHPDSAVFADVVQAGTRGWTGVAGHAGLDRICGLAYGATIPPGWTPGALECGPAAKGTASAPGASPAS